MASVVFVPCIGNPNKDMVLSFWTWNEVNAIDIVAKVGFSLRTPAYSPERGGVGQFDHYHSLVEKKGKDNLFHSPHAFFGLPL